MTNPLDTRTKSHDLVCDLVLEPVKRAGNRVLVVDAGARSGMLELPYSYASHAALVGFEPNPVEHEKLIKRDTDPIRAGHRPPRFAEEKYLDTALWDAGGSRKLAITNGPGTPTLMGEAHDAVTSNMYLEGQGVSFYDSALRVIKEESVKVQRLDALIDPATTIDYLKIDVEGAELRVLKGASRLLESRHILVIRSEFAVFPYHDDHPILGDQHLFLNDFGFRLIDFDPSPARYTRGATRIPVIQDRQPLYGGDAVYFLDPDRCAMSPLDLQRMAAITFALGFASLGIGLLRDANLLAHGEIEDIEDALGKVPLNRRVLRAWEQAPHKVRRAATLGRRFVIRKKRRATNS